MTEDQRLVPNTDWRVYGFRYRRWSPLRFFAWLRRRLSRVTGTPPERGSWVLSASTGTKDRGRPILAMGITAGCSFSYPPGNRWAVSDGQTFRLRVSSFTARGCSGDLRVGVNPGPKPLRSVD